MIRQIELVTELAAHLHRRLKVRAAEDGADGARDRQRERVHAHPPHSTRRREQQRGLQEHLAAALQAVLVAQRHDERLVAVHAREHHVCSGGAGHA